MMFDSLMKAAASTLHAKYLERFVLCVFNNALGTYNPTRGNNRERTIHI